jgi:hypothetical protein
MIKANEETAVDLNTLSEFIAGTEDGATRSWVEVEQATGVAMSMRGRSLFRRAMRKAKREYYPLPGSGIRFSDHRNTVEIVRLRDARIAGAAKRANKASGRLQTRHLEELSAPDRAEFLMRASLRGALLSGSKGLKQLQGERPELALPQLPKI